MMNRETAILQEISSQKCHNVIQLRQHFYSESMAKVASDPTPASALLAPDGKKYLNLVTDFMPLNLSKFN